MGFFDKLWKKGVDPKTSGDAGMPSSNPAKTTQVSSYLTYKSIYFVQPGLSKQDVLVELMATMELPDQAAALKAVTDREAAGPTVIAPGIAVPHARVEGLSKITAALGICPAGIMDPAADGGPIHLFILFVGPTGNMREHLGFLASVASLFQLEGFGNTLLQQTTPVHILEKIKAAEHALQ